MKKREEEKDSRRSLLEEGRHVARLCFRLFSGCIVRKRARAHTRFRRSSSFLFFWDVSARTFHFVATRIIFFLSQEIKKHLLGRGSLIYHLVQPVTEVRPQTKGTIFNFVSSLKLSLEAPTLKKKKKGKDEEETSNNASPLLLLKRFFITTYDDKHRVAFSR